MNPKQSTMIRAMTTDGAIRVLYAETTAIVNDAHKIHNTSKTMTAVLGRALTGTSLIGSAASGEGLVNVYRGTGRVLMAPVANGIV